MFKRQHYYEHNTFGTRFLGGGVPSGYTINPAAGAVVDTDNTFAISEAQIMDEDIINTCSALPDPDGTSTDYTIFYRDSPTTWVWLLSAVPFPYSGTYIQWDNNGVLTTGVNTNYYNSYLLYANIQSQARFVIVPGRGNFGSLVTAQAEDVSQFDWTGLGISEFVVAYQFTWHAANASTSKGKVRLAIAPVRINTNFVISASAAITPNHNSLVGLQGGAINEFYHLTSNDYNRAINYCANGNFESNTTGWEINGCLSIAISASSPLTGDDSALISSSAPFGTGGYVGYSFAIGTELKNNIFKVSFFYSFVSGFQSELPFYLRVYDVTNGKYVDSQSIIQKLPNGSGLYITAFQASSNSINYQLRFIYELLNRWPGKGPYIRNRLFRGPSLNALTSPVYNMETPFENFNRELASFTYKIDNLRIISDQFPTRYVDTNNTILYTPGE